MSMVIAVIEHALVITSFVFIMMVLIEYINVQTSGRWQVGLKRSRWKQYALASVLGAMPGCLGAFTVVSLYAHRVMTFGALVTAMIATSGDEAFVMFSMFPRRALALTVVLFVVGWISGIVTDKLYRKKPTLQPHTTHDLELHEPDTCRCFQKHEILRQLKGISFPRALLLGLLAVFFFALIVGSVGPREWNWIKFTLLGSTLFALFVTATVPDHFLEEHLWEHVLKKHLLRIFAWTLGALVVIQVLQSYLDIDAWVQGNTAVVLVVAALLGLIPQSGPHLVLVTLYAQGSVPFGILLANSIVQDGHGALPLLAVSKRAFIRLKLINLLFGLVLGALALLLEH